MFHDIAILVIGLVLIMVGANGLTDGASAIARKFKVSDLVIGLTIVALGSSAPDFVVSMMSTVAGKSTIAVGDVVGANIFDILLVIGICALVKPIVVGEQTLMKEMPMVILSSAVLFVAGSSGLIDGTGTNSIGRAMGILILFFFIIYMVITFLIARQQDSSVSAGNNPPSQKPKKMWLAAIFVVAGLIGLVTGGNWIVDGASGIARRFGMSEAMVGLTIVAIGGSVPDLFTSLAAALKGHSGIAVGNVVGSCVFNVLFVLGSCATVHPLEMGNINIVDLGVLLGGSVLLWIFGWFWGKRTIKRWEGAVLTLCYITYFTYLIFNFYSK